MSDEETPATGLSIRDLAGRTGVPPATLRSWEARYGVPEPSRLPGGHRRYDEQQVWRVEEMLRLRDSGVGLAVAAGQVAAVADPSTTSVFAGLRARHAALSPRVLRKSTLLALAWALEDECTARAEQPALYASFQRVAQYEQARTRWDELTRTARTVVVFADFTDSPSPRDAPIKVPVPVDSPMRREWSVVCDSVTYPACLSAWQVPPAPGDQEPRFEAVWSVEPGVVRDAALISATLATTWAPQLAEVLAPAATGTAPSASADLRRATGLLDRMLGYLDRARPIGA